MPEILDWLPIFSETVDTIRARLDADANAGVDPTDSRFIDTTPGGFYWDNTQTAVMEFERDYDALNEAAAAMHPGWAWGEYLDEWGDVLNVARKESVKATGEVVLAGAVGTLISAGAQLATLQVDPETDPITFLTTQSVKISPAPGPVGLAGTPSAAGGTLPVGPVYYKVTAVVPAGETVASAETLVTMPAQTLAAPAGLGSTAFTSGGVLASGTYYYKVTALNANGETIASAEHSRAVTGPTGRVDLTWTAVTGATSYRVYRGASAGAENVYYATATNSYSDTGSAAGTGAPPGSNTAQVGQVALDWADYATATAYRVYRAYVSGAETFVAQVGASAYTDTGAASTGAPAPTNAAAVEAAEAGAEGNVAAGTITQPMTPVEGLTSVTNLAATSGGADVEGDELYRDRILLRLRQPPGAGNVGDYERWARDYAPVGYATVEALWAGAGTVRVVVTDQDNNPVSATVVSGLQAQLDPQAGRGGGLAPVGATVTVATPSAVLVTIAASVAFVSADYTLDGAGGTIATRADIVASIAEYVDGLKPGDDVVLNHTRSQFFRVPGVLDVTGLTLNGSANNLPIAALEVANLGTVTLT